MALIIGLVFVGVFTLIALPLAAMGPSNSAKQALATLDSAIKVDRRELLPQKLNVRKNEMLSSIPWLNQKLLQFELTPYLRRMLSQADLDWSAGRLLLFCAAGFVIPAYALLQLTGQALLALVAGVILGVLPFAFVLFKRHRRFGAFEKNLPEALDLMVSGLRAGHSLLAAMALVARECPAPVNSEFKICFEEQNYGLEMKVALENLVTRVPLQDLEDHHHRDPDSEGKRRQPGRGAGQDGICHPGAFPVEAPDYGAHRVGASDGLDSDVVAGGAGRGHLLYRSGNDQHFVASQGRH